MQWTYRFLCLALAAILAACSNQARHETAGAEPSLFLDYTISATEGGDWATCMLQFKAGGPGGEAIAIPPPGRVEFDGKELGADSAGLSGIYYGTDLPLSSFGGAHSILFTAPDKKRYREEFRFQPFSLDSLPEQVPRAPFTVRLTGLPAGQTTVRLVMVDTAFANRDVNTRATVTDGNLRIDSSMLRDLSNGPISLEISHEEMRRVKEGWGRITVRYGLRRDFEIVDR